MTLKDELQQEGYELRPPDGSTFIDRNVAYEATCEKCGHHGLAYEGWRKDGIYRALAICPECGHVHEF